jgi:hypothetical protein
VSDDGTIQQPLVYTVESLIEALQAFPPDAAVVISVTAGEDANAVFSVRTVANVGVIDGRAVACIGGDHPHVFANDTLEPRPWGFVFSEE